MREIRTTLLPNGEQQVQAGGDFVYVDYVDREIKLMIHDQIITVNPGDKVRPARPFKSVTVINPDDTNPVAVVLKVGEGDYNSQIIRGDVSVTPVIRKADGTTVTDTRRKISVDLAPQFDSDRDYVAGDILVQTDTAGGDKWVAHAGGYYSVWAGGGDVFMYRRNLANLQIESMAGLVHPDVPYSNTAPNQMAGAESGNLIYGIYYNDWLASIDVKTGAVTPLVDLSAQVSPRGLIVVGGQIVVTPESGQACAVYSLDGEYLGPESMPPGVTNIVTGYHEGEGIVQAYDGNGSKLYRLKRNTGAAWEVLDSRGLTGAGAPFPASGGVVPAVGLGTAVMWSGGSLVTKRTTYPFSVPVSGVGVLASCGAVFNRLAKRRGLVEAVPTRAAVEVEWLGRRATVKGEVVRLALEWYFGGYVPENYMDYVYGVRIFKGPNPGAEVNVQSGGETFQKAKIADEFATYLPGKIELVIDNGITGKPLF